MLGACGVRDACDTVVDEQWGGGGDIADQPQSVSPLDEQRVRVWQESKGVCVGQSASQDVDTDVMLFGRIEAIWPGSQGLRSDANVFGRHRRAGRQVADYRNHCSAHRATKESTFRGHHQYSIKQGFEGNVERLAL